LGKAASDTPFITEVIDRLKAWLLQSPSEGLTFRCRRGDSSRTLKVHGLLWEELETADFKAGGGLAQRGVGSWQAATALATICQDKQGLTG
jgi:hypothetical protein